MVTKMKNSLHKSLNIKFSFLKRHPSLIAATILDPRFKFKYLNSDEVDIAMTEIISFLTECNDDPVLSGSEENVSLVSSELNLSASNIQQEKECLWDTHDNTPKQMEKTGTDDQKNF